MPPLHCNFSSSGDATDGLALSRGKVVWGLRPLVIIGVLLLASAISAFGQVRVTATWDANADGVTRGYRVFVGVTSGVYLASYDAGTQNSAQLDLPAGQLYFVAVRAYNAAGLFGPASGEATIDLSAVPDAPVGLRVSIDGSVATLEWSRPVGGGVPTHYLLTVGSAPGGADIANAYPVGPGLSVRGQLPPGRYYARLQAANGLEVGPYSQELVFEVGESDEPSAPSALSVSWHGTVATLSWTAPAGADAANSPTSYLIEAGRASGASDFVRFDVGNMTSYSADVPLGTYYVRVRGVNASGVSRPTNEVVLQGRGGPGRPTGLSESGSGSSVLLRWNAPGGAVALTGYLIEVGSAPGSSDLGVLTIGNQTSFAATAPTGTYYVRVRAVNARGAGEASNEVVVRR